MVLGIETLHKGTACLTVWQHVGYAAAYVYMSIWGFIVRRILILTLFCTCQNRLLPIYGQVRLDWCYMITMLLKLQGWHLIKNMSLRHRLSNFHEHMTLLPCHDMLSVRTWYPGTCDQSCWPGWSMWSPCLGVVWCGLATAESLTRSTQP